MASAGHAQKELEIHVCVCVCEQTRPCVYAMQISEPSKWLNKLKRPQGEPIPICIYLSTHYPHLIAFYFSNIYYYRVLKRYPNAKMHVRWRHCTSDTTHMHIHIYRDTIYLYPIELYAARMMSKHAMRRARYSLTLHETTHYAFVLPLSLLRFIAYPFPYYGEWFSSRI